MAIIDTLRPTATVSSLDWTSVPVSGAAWVVTADNSDATYVVGQVGDAPLVLSVGPHGVPAGHRRHLARVRARGRSGQVTGSVRLPGGSGNVAFSTFDFDTGSFETLVGSYQGGLPPTAAGDFGVTLTAESASVNVAELYVDIDSRAQPTYDPQVSDDSTATTTITTTSAPTVEIINVDTDSLPVARWRAWVTPQNSSTIVWDSGSVGGSPIPTQTSPLVNGAYTLHVQLWSALGDGSEYPGAEDTLDFTVNLQPVTVPCGLTVTQRVDTPLFDVEVCVPNSLADYDGDVYAEVQRTDCDGEWMTIDLTGPVTVSGTATVVDWSAPRTFGGTACDPAEVCEFEYRVRFVGTVDGQLVTSEWVYESTDTAYVIYNFSSLSPTLEFGGGALTITGAAGSYASTPDAAIVDITGDIDIRAYVEPTDWTPSADRCIMSKSNTASNQRSWHLVLQSPGNLRFFWSTDGTGAGGTNVDSTVATGFTDGTAHWVRVTRSFTTGDVTFFTSGDGVTWTQLGATVSGTAGSMFNSSAALSVGARSAGGADIWVGRIHAVEVRSGIGDAGTVVANPDFREQSDGDTSFVDEAGRTWTVNGLALIITTVQGSTVTGVGLSISILSLGYSTDPELNTGTMPTSGFNANQYFTLTVSTNNTNTVLPLDQLRRLRLKAAKSSASGQRGFHLRTSADLFAADVYATAVPTTRTTWSQYDLALNIPVTGSSITLHLHTYAVSGGSMEVDDIEAYFGDPVTHSLEWPTGDILLRTEDADGPLWAAACGVASWDVDKPFTAQLGVMGGQQVSSGDPGGHDLTLNLGVTSQEDLENLQRILERQLVLVSPADSAEQWSAPSDESVQVLKIRGVRTLVTRMVGTGPEPAHEPGEVLE